MDNSRLPVGLFPGAGIALTPQEKAALERQEFLAYQRQRREQAAAERDASSNRVRNGIFDFMEQTVGTSPEWSGRAAGLVTDWVPGFDDTTGAEDTYQAAKVGDWKGATISGVATGVGILPLVGTPLSKGVKAIARGADDLAGAVRHADDVTPPPAVRMLADDAAMSAAVPSPAAAKAARTVPLFHGTTPEGLAGIQEAGKIRGPAYFSPRREIAGQYGAEIVEAQVPHDRLLVDLDMPGGRLLTPEVAAEYLGEPGLTIDDLIERGYSVGTNESVPILPLVGTPITPPPAVRMLADDAAMSAAVPSPSAADIDLSDVAVRPPEVNPRAVPGDNRGPPLEDDLQTTLGTAPTTPVNIQAEELQGLLSSLSPEQRNMITPQQEEAFLRAAQTQKPDELAAMAMAGAPKIGWYQNSAQALHHIFGEDTPRFTTLLAATSPQTSVESNLGNALSIWKHWTAAGRPTNPNAIRRIMGQAVQGGKGEGSILPAWINNSVTALSATPEQLVLSGPKVNEFAEATAGDLNRYVLDAWMANASGVPQTMFSKKPSARSPVTGYGPGYLGPTAVGRSVAKQMTEQVGKAMGLDVKPSHVQEAVWSWAKAAFEARKAEGIDGRTIREIVEAGELTPEIIDAVPDFSTLLNTDAYASLLREAGYGQKLDELAGQSFGGKLTTEQRAAFAGSLDRAALLRGADRLDRLFEARTHASRTGAFRAGFAPSGGTSGGGYSRASGPRNRPVPIDGRRVAAVHTPTPEYQQALQWSPQFRPATPDFHELADDPVNRLHFSTTMAAAKESRGAGAAGVDVHAPDKYRGQKMFMTPDNTAGFSIGRDGELNSVLSSRSSPHQGISDAALNVATANGATWLSAFDIGLPQKYARQGFKPVARVPFNDEYAPPGWDYERMGVFNKGRPDVVFMVYDPDFKGSVAERHGGRIMKDYEQAQAYARGAASKERAKDRTQMSVEDEEDELE